MISTLARRSLATVLAATLTLGAVPAFAQSAEDRAAARALAAEGAKLMDAKDYAGALDRFKRAESLVHAPPHQLYIARAYAGLGKLVLARETYLVIVRENLAPDAPKAFADAKASAQTELDALEPRLAMLQVDVGGAPEGAKVSVTVDGQPLAGALVGVSRPIDPGTHAIEASAPGFAGKTSVTLAEGAKEKVTVALEPTSVAATPAQPAEGAEPSSTTTTTSKDVAPSAGPPVLAYVSLGVGAIAVGAGTYFLLHASSKRDEADQLCGSGACPEARRAEIEDLDADADRSQVISYVGFGVGAAAIGAGIYLLLSKPDPKQTATGPVVRPYATLGGFGLTGSF